MFKKIFLFIIFFFITLKVNAEQSFAIVDMDFLVNNSKAGKYIQSNIKSHNDKIKAQFVKKEKKIKEEEKKLISQKNVLTEEDYKKKIQELNKQIIAYTEERKKEISKSNKKKNDALVKLLANINNILVDYAAKNKIALVLDKKNIIITENSNDITQKIFEILDKKITKIKIK